MHTVKKEKKKKVLFLQENSGSWGYQGLPIKNTAAQ